MGLFRLNQEQGGAQQRIKHDGRPMPVRDSPVDSHRPNSAMINWKRFQRDSATIPVLKLSIPYNQRI
jgi:hypothetical protein